MERPTSLSCDLCLNRTFYGIETMVYIGADIVLAVLIVPFMELKRITISCTPSTGFGLNRTFYGIETLEPCSR